MSKNAAIEIFLRVRPTKRKSDKFHTISEDGKAVFTGLKQMKKGEYVNNTRNEYSYCFNNVFGMETKQEEIFEGVAKDVIDNAFEGYNGTIFAYGQTGSGKTYTMTGAAERYCDRGIIPRTISYIFSEAGRRTDTEFNINISYLEIYNNDGYDLLSEDHASKQLSDLPRVMPMERSNGELVLSGLSSHRVGKEEDALNLLFIGDTNRVVCETPMNDASTRSHCIFIVTIESRKHDSDVKTISKVHLVDLSGSERVGKTGVNGQLLKEACYINLSLHYLEQVINMLQKKMNASDPDQYFIPYRNSLMTMVLRDSLGGNCKTRMISTVHVEDEYLDESISTCNFAMRVALIKNTVVRNEAVDPSIIIQKLKRENQELRAEIAILRGGQVKTDLTGEDVARCQKMVQEYVAARDSTQKLILSDPLMIAHCFSELKSIIQSRPIQSTPKSTVKEVVIKEDIEKVRKLEEEITKLKLILKQRENEIMIFLNLINKKANSSGEENNTLKPENFGQPTTVKEIREKESRDNLSNLRMTQELRFPEYSKKEEDQNYQMVYSVVKDDGTVIDYKAGASNIGSAKSSYKTETKPSLSKAISSNSDNQQNLMRKPTIELERSTTTQAASKEMSQLNKLLTAPLSVTREQLMNRQQCLEMFRRSYRKSEALQEDLGLLQDLTSRGKKHAEEVKQLKGGLDSLKNSIEDLRRRQALQGMKQGGEWVRTPEEENMLSEVESRKKKLKESIDKVKEIKEEILRVQLNYENSVKRMNSDFERWLQQMMVEQGLNNSVHEKIKMEETINTSTLNETFQGMNTSVASRVTGIRDERVKKDLEAFYRAKEEIQNRATKLGG